MMKRNLRSLWNMKALSLSLFVLAACGSRIESDSTSDGPLDGGTDSRRDAGDTAIPPRPDGALPPPIEEVGPIGKDGGQPIQEPNCKDAGPPKQGELECDLNNPSKNCSPNEACYPMIEYPKKPCDVEVYSTRCLASGSGTQGTSCQYLNDCKAGFVCVISGAGDQCVKLCELGQIGSCPEGLVCQPLDVPGRGVCN